MQAVNCSGLWKRYRLKTFRIRQIREAIGLWMAGRHPNGAPQGDFWALRDFSLKIATGEAVGILGDNGAGKSTVLKVIAGVTYPTKGQVEVRGRVGALIEVGTGMHPELTGRENIFLHGMILGLPRMEVRRKFDSIVEFAGLSDFLDVPLKRYSSGGRIRLGFSVAAHLDPDILLVDEALGIGDLAFQKKCLERITELRRNGTTIVFVSHELTALERVCDRAVWIQGGHVQADGRTSDVVARYREFVEHRLAESSPQTLIGKLLEIERVTLSDRSGTPRLTFQPGETVTVNLHYYVREPVVVPALIALRITDERRGAVLAAHSDHLPLGVELSGRGVIRCAFEKPPLAPRTYQLWGSILRLPALEEDIAWQPLATFTVAGPPAASLPTSLALQWDTPVMSVPVAWDVNSRTNGD